MIPQPPGRCSSCRAGNGFQMSKARKSIKPKSQLFQLRLVANGVGVVNLVFGFAAAVG